LAYPAETHLVRLSRQEKPLRVIATLGTSFAKAVKGGEPNPLISEVSELIKQDIIHNVIERTGLPRNKAEAAVDTVFESLKKALAAGDRIELRGFGVFNVRPRKTGIGRNPRTGAEVTISPGKAVRFKPGKELHLTEGAATTESADHGDGNKGE
jgi:nucleoid DNA-binding protein